MNSRQLRPVPMITWGDVAAMLISAIVLLLLAGALTAGPDLSLPPASTPGATNPQVTQAKIDSTVCVAGWTKTVRPPSSYTMRLKRRQLASSRYTDKRTRDYEEDHLISLELGGAPRDPKNLWPEPYFGQWNARTKDQLEDELHRRVCAHRLGLAAAQAAVSRHWIDAYRRYVK